VNRSHLLCTQDDALAASDRHQAELLGTGVMSLRSFFSSSKQFADIQLLSRSGEKLGSATLLVRKIPKDTEGATHSTSAFRLRFQGRQLPFVSPSHGGGVAIPLEFGVCVDTYQRTYSSGKFSFVGQTELSIGSESVDYEQPVVVQRRDSDDVEVCILAQLNPCFAVLLRV
jgi:hypothetical protein